MRRPRASTPAATAGRMPALQQQYRRYPQKRVGPRVLARATLRFSMLTILLGFAMVAAQTSNVSLAQRAAAVMRQSVRDAVEAPFEVRSTIRRYDREGKLRKTSIRKHHLQITGEKLGLRSIEGLQLRMKHINRGDFALLRDADVMAIVPGLAVAYAGAEDRRDLVLEATQEGEQIVVSYRVTHACRAFGHDDKEKLVRGKLVIVESCGVGRVVLDAATLRPVRAEFEAAGLPAMAGKETLRGFHAEEEFQAVSAGTGAPLLLPKRVRAAYESDSGRIEVESEFALARK